MSDLRSDEWLTVELAVHVQEPAVPDILPEIKKHAKALAWKTYVLDSDVESDEGVMYKKVAARPKKNGLISPSNWKKITQQAIRQATALTNSLGARKQEVLHDPFSGIEVESMTKNDLIGYWCVAFESRGVSLTNILTVTFPAVTRVEFDAQHPALAQELFGTTVSEVVSNYKLHASFLDRILKGKVYVQALQRSKKRLADWFSLI